MNAREIAELLDRPAPTDEQAAVIEAPPSASALVVAGAGSGKTETMASRVLWLVANDHARPDQILGLTFTRKAAGELGTRIRTLLHRLRDASGRSAGAGPRDHDPFDEPTVATYNSFANTIRLENSAVLGRDPDGPVLGEAAAWQLVRTIVLRADDPRMLELEKSLTQVVDAVLGLSRAIAENVADADAVREFARDFAEVSMLPPGGRGEYPDVAAWAREVGSLDLLVELAERYRAEKERRSAIEYSDQVALALQAVRARASVGEELRRRYPIVLLDEYQDTSVVQTRLLHELFGPTAGRAASAVTAVGDPNQSIYGWRGASESNLADFSAMFASVRTYPLSMSWRNGTRILGAANTLVSNPDRDLSPVGVDALLPAPFATEHDIDVRIGQTIDEETAAVAEWLRDRVGPATTAALLFRSRRTQSRFLAALREHDVPYHVLGLGGLLAEPEVADLVSALTVLSDPSAGLELVRLLAGARWRIGPADLHALSRLAGWLRERDDRQRRYDAEVAGRMRASIATADRASLVDALDALRWMRDDHTELERFSVDGLARLRDAAETLDALRTHSGSELPDLATLVEHELRLDIEVAANPHRPPGAAAMEAFHDALRGYLGLAEAGTLGGFLAWLRAAEQKEDLSPRPEPPEPGVVQMLTIHGAKGLEWDVVAVPRLVEEELPARQQEGSGGWLRFGELPWEFRGDADELPGLDWRAATTRRELADLVGKPDRPESFKGRVRARFQAEERRLAYVAITRARHRLLLSASFWAGQVQPRTPSRFLVELADAGRISEIRDAPDRDENPLADLRAPMFPWPRDPLGSPRRRRAVESAAALVRTSQPRLAGPWAADLELLVAERRARLDGARAIPLPTRIAASRFHDVVGDPDAVARATLRPLPERPYRATRLGTLFHAWVEARYGVVGGSDELDAEPFELDDAPVERGGDAVPPDDLAALRALQETFAASEWASRRPLEVEREIHLPFDGRIVVCKLDAVYEVPGSGGDARYEVVDWKTGRAPVDADDLARKRLQLALYRVAYARWRGIDPARIDAAFYFVADDRVVRPDGLESEAELAELWRRAAGWPVT